MATYKHNEYDWSKFNNPTKDILGNPREGGLGNQTTKGHGGVKVGDDDSVAITSLTQPKSQKHVDIREKYEAHKEAYTKKYDLPAFEGNTPTEPFKKYVSEYAGEKYKRSSLVAKLDK